MIRQKQARSYVPIALMMIIALGACGSKSRDESQSAAPNPSGAAVNTAIRAIQREMNNPASLTIVGEKVVPTKLPDGQDVLNVYVLYRGENAFGGTVTEKVIVTTDSTGEMAIAVNKVP
jgi:hypothetical protein